MDWLTILLCIIVAVLALKFLKLIGKIVSVIVIVIALCIFLESVFSINIVQLAQNLISSL